MKNNPTHAIHQATKLNNWDQNPSTKNCIISITRSTSDPLKASPTTIQPLETQLNNLEEGTRLTVAPRELVVAPTTWAGDGWQRWRESRWWVVMKKVEPVMKMVELVMGETEGLMVGWVVERNLRKHKSEREAVHRDWESAINVKYFVNISSVNFTQICV